MKSSKDAIFFLNHMIHNIKKDRFDNQPSKLRNTNCGEK